MSGSTIVDGRPNEVAILGRILEGEGRAMTPELARYILGLGFNHDEKARMQELAAKNQEGALTPAEREELLAFANAGCLLGILQSRARRAMRKKPGRKAE